MSRVAVPAAILLAAALRLLPLAAPPLGVELDAAYPRHAVRSVVDHDWKPLSPVHGALLPDVLRALTTATYAAGRVTGRWHDRLGLLADFVRDPLPFVMLGRAVLVAFALVAVWLAAVLATRLGGRLAGAGAAVLLATSYVHVRSSFQVWPDGVAATCAIASVLAALRHLERRTLGSALALGASAGVALAGKHALVPLALPVALALVWDGRSAPAARLRHVVAASIVALVTFLALSPYVVIDWRIVRLMMTVQAEGSFAAGGPARIPWATLVRITLGIGPLVLALVGIVVVIARHGRAGVVAAAFPIAYLAMLARANPYARYFAIAAPFVAAFAGAGAVALAERLAPQRTGLVTAALVALAALGPAYASWQHVALLRRPDTRVLAGAWLAEHVPYGTPITLPNIAPYANPVVPFDAFTLRLEYPTVRDALVARGIADPARSWPCRYQGMLSSYDGAFAPRDPIVVTAEHPAPNRALATPAVNAERLRAAGYTIAARFEGVPEPPPPGVRWDPQDADYAPLTGAALVPHLGPTLTIWRAP